MDCTAQVKLCQDHAIQGFPTVRVFRLGHDDPREAANTDPDDISTVITNTGKRMKYEAYYGPRTGTLSNEYIYFWACTGGQILSLPNVLSPRTQRQARCVFNGND